MSGRGSSEVTVIGDAERADIKLGWKALRSDLEVQILDAWNWMNKYG
jgi:UDP-glucose 4-epimerase